MTGNNKNDAIYAITVMGEKHPVRVMIGKLNGEQYVKAQAWKDNDWKYLCIDYPAVYFCEIEKDVIVSHYNNPKIWLYDIGETLRG